MVLRRDTAATRLRYYGPAARYGCDTAALLWSCGATRLRYYGPAVLRPCGAEAQAGRLRCYSPALRHGSSGTAALLWSCGAEAQAGRLCCYGPAARHGCDTAAVLWPCGAIRLRHGCAAMAMRRPASTCAGAGRLLVYRPRLPCQRLGVDINHLIERLPICDVVA